MSNSDLSVLSRDKTTGRGTDPAPRLCRCLVPLAVANRVFGKDALMPRIEELNEVLVA
jgi:hypothetical protein